MSSYVAELFMSIFNLYNSLSPTQISPKMFKFKYNVQKLVISGGSRMLLLAFYIAILFVMNAMGRQPKIVQFAQLTKFYKMETAFVIQLQVTTMILTESARQTVQEDTMQMILLIHVFLIVMSRQINSNITIPTQI